jgi:hypothetical protein
MKLGYKNTTKTKEGEIAVNETIKEYLVSLGFNVDLASYADFNKALDMSETAIQSFGSTAISTFLTASAAFASFVASVVVGMSKLVEETADADLEFSKFARQMLTTKENAKSVQMALDALGVSMEDLWLSPELLSQFQELRKLSTELEPPEDFNEQMQFIRSIKLEIAKAKMQIHYALQWVSYYLVKYLREPLQDFKNTLQSLNEFIKDKLPQWTKYVAQFASWAFRLFNMIVGAGKGLIELLDKIPANAKKMILALLALAPLLAGNPFFIMIAMITTLLLLMEDFYTFTQGGESALGDFWKSLATVGKEGGDALGGIFGMLTEELGEVAEAAIEATQAFLSLFGIDNAEDFKTVITDLAALIGDRLVGELQNVADLLTFIKEIFEFLDDAFDRMPELFPTPEDAPWDLDNFKKKYYGQLQTSYGGGLTASAAGQTGNDIDINNNPTFNIYGSDPYSTANNANGNMEKMLIRSLRGGLA